MLSLVHLLHQINRRWESLVLNECSSLFSCIWQHEQRQGGWFWQLTCSGIFCPGVGESSLLPGAADRPVSPGTLELMHGHVFLTGCLKCSPELFDQVLQTLFTVLLFAALTAAFITENFIWVREEHTQGFESTVHPQRVLDRSLASLIRVEQLEKCSPWQARVILGHLTPGKGSRADRGCRSVLKSLCDRRGLSRGGRRGTWDNSWTWQLCGCPD